MIESLSDEMQSAIAEMKDALKAQRKHQRLNHETRKKNSKIKANNSGLDRDDPKRKRLLKLPHKLPEKARRILYGEITNKRERNQLTWEEWHERIQGIPDVATRNRVGCFVWWDQVGLTSGGKPTDLFDEYLQARGREWEPHVVAEALYSIGYSAWAAYKRANPPVGHKRKPKQPSPRTTTRRDWIEGAQHKENQWEPKGYKPEPESLYEW